MGQGEGRAGRWSLVETDGTEALKGIVRLSEAHAADLLKQSGRRGVFIEEIQAIRVATSMVQWIAPSQDESPVDYFARAITLAEGAKAPLVHRTGGGAALGLRGIEGATNSAPQFLLLGAPKSWGPMTLDGFLRKHGWTDIKKLEEPRNAKQGWLIQARPKASDTDQEDVFMYRCNSQTLTIRRWTKQRSHSATSRPLPALSAWVRCADLGPKPPFQQPAAPRGRSLTKQVGFRNPPGEDSESSRSRSRGKEGGTDTNMPPADGGVEAAATGSATDSTFAAPAIVGAAAKDKLPEPETGPFGSKLWNLGGSGDCGFRCVAAAIGPSQRPRQSLH
jgi:hypothetical protein